MSLAERDAFRAERYAIVVLGAGANCGRMGVQFARVAGFGIIVAVAAAKERNAKLLTELEATRVVDRHAENVEESVRAVGCSLCLTR